MSHIKRGLGDNSINTSDYVSWQDLLRKALKVLRHCREKSRDIQDMHTASHGDEYTFKDEINQEESCPALGREVYGVRRKCNPYEKKNFAGKANHELDNLWSMLVTAESDLDKVNNQLIKHIRPELENTITHTYGAIDADCEEIDKDGGYDA
tara:strand:+ start:660 stop:1115 length:456 start_codon:yes stop_codon:yes gene_type:complete